MKKNTWKILTVALVIMVVSIRFYRKYQREKKREDQQELIKKQFERTNKSLQEQREIKWKNTQKRQQDSLDSIRKMQRNNNMKLLKETQKKLQEEGNKKN